MTSHIIIAPVKVDLDSHQLTASMAFW